MATEKIQSVFGKFASKMQVMIDARKDIFKPTWFTRYFDWGSTTVNLDFTTVIGRSRIEAAATIVDRDSPAPLRSRSQIEKLTGEVPAIKQAFKMTENDYRNFITIQSLPNVNDTTKRDMLLKLLWDDITKAGNGPMKKLDIMCLQAMSTGKVSIDANTNPDGLILGDIDLLMPSANLVKATAKWSITGSGDPTADIEGIVKIAKAKGVIFEKMMMRLETFWRMAKCDKFKSNISAFYNAGTGRTVAVTLERVNEYLLSNKFPIIEIVTEIIGIEKDGAISTIEPWSEYNVSFVPAGKFGIIHNAFSIEQLKPVNGIDYATADKVLISKYQQNDPWGEFTKGELNAFPGVEVIDQMVILQTETV
jgi:hypothetical protein